MERERKDRKEGQKAYEGIRSGRKVVRKEEQGKEGRKGGRKEGWTEGRRNDEYFQYKIVR